MKLLHDQLSFQKTSRTGEVIPGTSIKAGYGDNSAVSSFSMEGDSTGALESCIRAIAAILQGRVSCALTDGNPPSAEAPVYYIEYAGSEDAGEVPAKLLYDAQNILFSIEIEGTEARTREVLASGISGQELVGIPHPVFFAARICELIHTDPLVEKTGNPAADMEATRYMESAAKDFMENGILTTSDAVRMCDLIRKITASEEKNGDAVFDVDFGTEDTNLTYEPDITLAVTRDGKTPHITKDLTDMVSAGVCPAGTFEGLAGVSDEATPGKGIPGHRLCSEEEIPEQYRTPAYFPEIGPMVDRPQFRKVADYVYGTMGTAHPINTFSLFGPTGSGKSFMCKYLASEKCFGVPYFTVVCSGNKDESMFTGMLQNGENGKTVYVNSKFADYIQMPCVIELVEMNALDEDVALALNCFMDRDYGYLVTDDFHAIKRDPRCIVISTFNPGYAGTKTPNRSVIRRSAFAMDIDKVSAHEISGMIRRLAGLGEEDSDIVTAVTDLFTKLENYVEGSETMRGAAEVSMTEYADCAQILSLDRKFGHWNPAEAAKITVVNKLVSTMDFDKDIAAEIMDTVVAQTIKKLPAKPRKTV